MGSFARLKEKELHNLKWLDHTHTDYKDQKHCMGLSMNWTELYNGIFVGQ